jgi:hypothetical protein
MGVKIKIKEKGGKKEATLCANLDAFAQRSFQAFFISKIAGRTNITKTAGFEYFTPAPRNSPPYGTLNSWLSLMPSWGIPPENGPPFFSGGIILKYFLCLSIYLEAE